MSLFAELGTLAMVLQDSLVSAPLPRNPADQWWPLLLVVSFPFMYWMRRPQQTAGIQRLAGAQFRFIAAGVFGVLALLLWAPGVARDSPLRDFANALCILAFLCFSLFSHRWITLRLKRSAGPASGRGDHLPRV